MDYKIVTLEAYRAVGLKWSGTFNEIVPHLKNVIQEMENRSGELTEKINPGIQLGLSYHDIEHGFTHYSMFEVSENQGIPDGMIELFVPKMTYVKVTHHKGEDITTTYSKLHQWLFESDYTAFTDAGVTYFDPYMPIKHEHYPLDRDPKDPHFDIYIPIVKK